MDYLTNEAIKSIWSTPDQDYQAIIEPKRITPSYGTRKSFKQIYDYIKTPNADDVFHVFHIGQLNPRLLGLFPARRQWRTLAENMVEMNMLVNVYNEYGIQLNRSRCYYLVSSNNNLLLAITEPARVPVDPGNEKIYMRVYSNAYFNSVRKKDQQLIRYEGGILRTQGEIVDLQYNIENLRQPVDLYTHCFVNGYKVESINLLNATIGDEVEYVEDLSIKQVWNYPIKELKRYTSHMDQLAKYLVTYDEPYNGKEMIEFHDDIDLYVTDKYGSYRGVYIHRNDPRTLRMVNHRDYGVSIHTVEAITRGNNWNTSEDVRLQVFIRHSGYERPLVHEANRIHELFKLTPEQRVNAMVGDDALVAEWRAENLEASEYTKIMRNKDFQFDKHQVDTAFGYYASASLTSQTPTKTYTINGVNGIYTEPNLQLRSTAYEYDNLGKYLHSRPVYEAYTYYTTNQAAKLVEMVKGIGSDTLEDRYGLMTSDYDNRYDYRFYTCDIIDGVVQYNWKDVTGSGLYAIDEANKSLTWFINPRDTYTLVRNNATFLSYPITLTPSDGVLRFTLRNRIHLGDTLVTQEMKVPMDQLTLTLNGHALIENVDYYVDFPQVVITNKKFIQAPFSGPQEILVRYMGFCDPDMKHKVRGDMGYVSHELISKNQQFNLRDDKVLQILVGGRVYHRDDLRFSENKRPNKDLTELNGRPYLVRDLVVPIREVSSYDTYELLNEAQDLDQRISDYLTVRIPEEPAEYPNVLLEKYAIYSPFVSSILSDLMKGYLDVVFLYDQHSDDKVRELVQDYEYLLRFEPTQLDLRPDTRYVEIHPHPEHHVVEVPIHIYRFIQRVVDVYCNELVKLSHFLKLDTF